MCNIKNFKMHFPYFHDIGLMKFSVFRIVELYFTNAQKIVAFFSVPSTYDNCVR